MARLSLFATVALAALAAMSSARSPFDFRATETARIRAHLDSAERELRAKDVSSLTPAQRAARVRNLERLHEYWVRGVFPQNTDFPGERVPYFIDRFGTRCAMAYLIEQAGGGDLVARVAAARNNARIRDLSTDPALGAWLWRNGITLDEAARIQPSYGCCPIGALCIDREQPGCPLPTSPSSAGYKVATGVSVGVDVLTVALNSLHSGLARPLAGALGIAAGAAGIAVGVPNFDASGSRRTLGYVNAGVGAASAALGLYRIAHRPRTLSRVSLVPWLDGRGGTGLTAQLRF